MVDNIIRKFDKYKVGILFSLFSFHQLFYISKIGVWWDEPYDQLGAKLTLGKLNFIFFGTKSNQYRADFSDHELFGMFYQLQAFTFSKLNIFYGRFNLEPLGIRNEVHFTYFLRHIYLHFYTCLLLYIIYSLLRKIESDNFGFMYILFLILIPSVNGYSLFDDKDIPFGLHLFISFLLYFYFIHNISHTNKRRLTALTGIAFGLLLLIRFNGVGFLILTVISVNLINVKNIFNKKYIVDNLFVAIYAFLIFIFGTIQGSGNYLQFLKNLYWQQFKVATWFGETLVNGESFERSGDFTYIFKILFYKFPPAYLLSICILIFFWRKTNNNSLFISSVTFLSLFSIAFIVYKPAAYNYERQYLFIFFFVNLLVVFSLNLIKLKSLKVATIGFFVLFTMYSQYGLEEYKYIYVNEFVDENSISILDEDCFEFGNCGNWSTDHLSISGLSMAEMVSDLNIPVFSCAPYHTVSIFNEKNNFINLDNKFVFQSGVDIMDYTIERQSSPTLSSKVLLFKNKQQFSDYLLESNENAFSIISEHTLSSKGNGCLYDLKQLNNFQCTLGKENKVYLRGVKVTINYQLDCILDV